MDAVEEAIAALLRETAPERDAGFTLAIMMHIERRRFRTAVLMNVALMIASTILLALVLPSIERIWPANLSNFWLGALLVAASIMISRFKFADN